jgi:hypothetical protein
VGARGRGRRLWTYTFFGDSRKSGDVPVRRIPGKKSRFGSTLALVRRIWVAVIVALFSFTLISPAILSAPDDQKLPPCCRKNGKHHCAMAQVPVSSSDPAFQAGRCPLFNSIQTLPPLRTAAGLAKAPQPVFAALVTQRASRPQIEALARISFDRSSQKRGPPCLS